MSTDSARTFVWGLIWGVGEWRARCRYDGVSSGINGCRGCVWNALVGQYSLSRCTRQTRNSVSFVCGESSAGVALILRPPLLLDGSVAGGCVTFRSSIAASASFIGFVLLHGVELPRDCGVR